ncbi:putative candidate secreted effector protein [Blumeria hordei DH14]|uniref:Putative candidate secreted effector protein n=1 Tax=Blumeria graminis f. sp. hordei (strain DH14) TaxID=546991 RepID=N1JIV1_BLUG1|nr:putative candidate secreted effector protein [Blumeria hordei DH14]
MKFFSSAYTVALACLLSLVPIALGEKYFQCTQNKIFTMAELISHKSRYLETNMRHGNPLGPNGEVYPSRQYSTVPIGGYTTTYLFQLIDEAPTFNVYETQSRGFYPCNWIES